MKFQNCVTSQGPTLIRYISAAANIINDIGGVAGAPKNLSRRLGLFLISGGGVGDTSTNKYRHK